MFGWLSRAMGEAARRAGLAEIPLLGKLFRSRAISKNNTELLVMVTPELVRPLPADRGAACIVEALGALDGVHVAVVVQVRPTEALPSVGNRESAQERRERAVAVVPVEGVAHGPPIRLGPRGIGHEVEVEPAIAVVVEGNRAESQRAKTGGRRSSSITVVDKQQPS